MCARFLRQYTILNTAFYDFFFEVLYRISASPYIKNVLTTSEAHFWKKNKNVEPRLDSPLLYEQKDRESCSSLELLQSTVRKGV